MYRIVASRGLGEAVLEKDGQLYYTPGFDYDAGKGYQALKFDDPKQYQSLNIDDMAKRLRLNERDLAPITKGALEESLKGRLSMTRYDPPIEIENFRDWLRAVVDHEMKHAEPSFAAD